MKKGFNNFCLLSSRLKTPKLCSISSDFSSYLTLHSEADSFIQIPIHSRSHICSLLLHWHEMLKARELFMSTSLLIMTHILDLVSYDEMEKVYIRAKGAGKGKNTIFQADFRRQNFSGVNFPSLATPIIPIERSREAK